MATPRMERTATPGIFKRGASYVAVYRDPNGRQRKAFAKTLKEARRLKAAKTTDVNRGEHRELSQETFAAYAPTWIEAYAGRTRRGLLADTRDDYRKALERHAIPFLGRLRLSEIEPRDIKALAKEIGDQGVSQRTVTLALAPVKALLADAFEEGLIRSNPGAGVRIFVQPESEQSGEEEEEEVRALEPEQLERLLAELPAEWRPFYGFLAETGLRIGEAIEARFGDVDFGSKRLRVDRQFYRGKIRKPKGGKKREITLSQELAQALWRRRGADAELLFTAERGGRLIPSNLMSRVLKPAAARAGLADWVGHHTFRHTCATRLFRGRLDEDTGEIVDRWSAPQVQIFLGHSDPGFTLRVYVHLMPTDLPEPPSVGNTWATREAQTSRDNEDALAAVSSL